MIILLTGVTGLVGSHAAVTLLEGGHRVVALVRGGDRIDAERRVQEVLRAWPGWRDGAFPATSLTVARGDVSRPGCGLDNATLDLLGGSIDAIMHCAASVSFGGDDAARTLAVNVEGVRQVAALSRALGCRRLVHVSTAYVERALRGEGFRTAYERSKLEGERVMEEAAMRDGFAVSVVRPSIVTGDRTWGFTPTYHGIYPFLRCAVQFGPRIRRVRPSRWLPPDLYREGRANLVPADHLAAVLRGVVEEPSGGERVYYVTAPVPWPVRTLVEIVADHFGAVSRKDGDLTARDLLSPAEEQAFTSLLELYTPYFTADLEVDTAATEALMERRGIPPVANDPAWIRALLAWGTARNWTEA